MSGYTIGEIAAWLLLAGLLGFVLGWLVRELQVRARRARTPDASVIPPEPEPEPEPSEPEPEPSAPEPEPEPLPESESEPEPDDDRPSSEHVVKAKTRSKIYHAPGTPAYARTRADVWFRSAAEAEAAGYRPPKNVAQASASSSVDGPA